MPEFPSIDLLFEVLDKTKTTPQNGTRSKRTIIQSMNSTQKDPKGPNVLPHRQSLSRFMQTELMDLSHPQLVQVPIFGLALGRIAGAGVSATADSRPRTAADFVHTGRSERVVCFALQQQLERGKAPKGSEGLLHPAL